MNYIKQVITSQPFEVLGNFIYDVLISVKPEYLTLLIASISKFLVINTIFIEIFEWWSIESYSPTYVIYSY